MQLLAEINNETSIGKINACDNEDHLRINSNQSTGSINDEIEPSLDEDSE